MNRYAIICANRIDNVILWDSETPYDPGEGCELVPVVDLPAGIDIGWTLIDGTWIAPSPPADD